ncbi:MOSC domain-containing protein YiiM [Lentzea albidocapillata subsp. violacea]|uniref:MOSC domain-containing protein YiiM n=1 Tax=Lentzea albidocapillata subsp. violacea TaxID=128104 RepID=A0A1G8V3Y5_9PSEU|nr:MOSC domain-containing protein [Lentzea albidocapillata]SDJ60743.1 MOSC domain-containing protein YiiM [Lentzea albidocapillata subsp. violacea]
MPVVLSLNVAQKTVPVDYARAGATGIGKHPVDGPLRVSPTGAKGSAGSGVAGDSIADWTVHGGEYQAVYGYAREDLDWWQSELDVPLHNGQFGENLTTQGIDHTTALVGEQWQIGSALLEVTGPRIPCRTFAEFLGQRGWVKRFTQQARPGAYFRVLEEGLIGPGDEISVVHRPGHDVTVELFFRAVTTEAALLPRLLEAGDSVPPEVVDLVHKRSVVELDS